MCLIVKNDEACLEQCILSFKDFVEEIVIVDTGSTDNTPEIAQKYASIFEVYTECNDEDGKIKSFADARNRSLSHATQKWVMWIDSDDILSGGENLASIIANAEASQTIKRHDAVCFMFPYEYAYNDKNEVICVHYRERLFSNKNSFKAVNPVHEVFIPKDGQNVAFDRREDVVYKHRRQYIGKVTESGRNLRILKKYVEEIGDSDARQLYYLGLEYFNVRDFDEATNCFTKYINLSGWDDECCMACLKMVELCEIQANYTEGLKWAFKAIETKENWSEGYFALARMFYFIANKGGPYEHRNWEKCAHFAKIGLSLPPTKTLLFINPQEREHLIHLYLNMALSKLGDIEGALESANKGLQARSDDGMLLANKKFYEVFLASNKAYEAINTLTTNGHIDETAKESLLGIIKKEISFAKPAMEDGSPFSIAKASNEENIWAIPSKSDFDSYPIKMTDEQLQSVVIMIWKQYMLHDEVLSAISFLKNAPYNVRHTFATQKALSLTEACLNWMDDKADFQKVNAPAFPDREAGNPLPNKLIMSEGHRFDLIADHLPPNTTLVDFGSMDGCFTNRYGMLGHKPTGLDVCETSVALANKKAIEFNTGAKHVCTYFQDAVGKVPSNHFEYATSSDTYEHVKDPVNDMFLPAKAMLKEDGKFLLATPHGAWMRGKFIEWAHPWVWSREGKSWLQPSPRAHLIAPTPWSVAAHFREAGFWVKNSYASYCVPQDAPDQGNIFAEAHLKAPKNDSPLDIVMFAGDGVEFWTPETVKLSGIGGSELMLMEQAKRFVALGHRVRVYNSCGKYGDGIYDGVEYHQTEKYQDLKCDILIVSRRADMLADKYNITSTLKLLWVHDVCAIAASNELLLKADRILALSEWHKQNLLIVHNLHPNHVIVTRNGIDLERFEESIPRNKFKCVNSSSPDRSWPILLDVWPRIKKLVPKAELHLYYGFKNWEYSARHDPKQMDLINYLKAKIEELSPLGVVYHDRLNQKELAREFLSAGTWVHPTWFTETSCITAMEMQAAGLRMVTSNIAALKETVGDRGTLLDGDWTTEEYKQAFVDGVVKALKSTKAADRINLRQYAKLNFGLDTLAEDWQSMFKELIQNKKVNPIVPYVPTKAYK
jgi:glycosyltransferase involved in cell wall biosynthesis/2-polyprenyl-3-methyl-5-hydroxy-6-metoxy-1,4-benzoquinol methylase